MLNIILNYYKRMNDSKVQYKTLTVYKSQSTYIVMRFSARSYYLLQN